jgi:hypothetical protein
VTNPTKDQPPVERIREAIVGGRLPREAPQRLWGGRGIGAACAICGEWISPGQFEYEFECAPAGNRYGRASFHVHTDCYSAWERERAAFRRSQSDA